MKKSLQTVFILFLIFLFGNSFAQQLNNKKIDSLNNIVAHPIPDSVAIKAYDALGFEFQYIDLGQSIQNYRYEFNLQKSKNDQKGMATSLRKMGNDYLRNMIYEKALEYYLQSLKICESIDDQKGMAGCYNNIGNVYSRQGDLSGNLSDYKQSVDYHKKALQLRIEMGDYDNVTNSLLNIGNAYRGLGMLDTALKSYSLAYEQYKGRGDVNGIDLAKINIGEIYLDKGNKNHDKLDYAKAKECFLDRLVSYGDGDSEHKSSVLVDIGEIYLMEDDFKNAFSYLDDGLQMGERIHQTEVMKNAAKFLAELFANKGDYKTAFDYSKLYDSLKDSLITEQKTANISRMQVAYETAEKENQIKGLEKDKQISELEIENTNADRKRQRIISISFGLAVLVLLLIAFLLFNRYKLKQKANAELSVAYNLVERKNSQITDSITYAKRIQDSILPSEESLKTFFPESFVFFLPRDIVSGDFYWFSERNGKFFIALADCTGHGVPGALMSMIGNTLLNEIVNEKGIHSPAAILAHLDEGIATALHQGNSDAKGQDDGMDISFCVIDRAAKKITFSGANHSLYIFVSGKLEEIKGDIFSIGGMFGAREKSFSEKTIDITQPISIYMTSDGYYDQFGGEQNRKFMSGKFQEMIAQSANEKMDAQKKIIGETFSKWKGEGKQLDDVLVIGMKI